MNNSVLTQFPALHQTVNGQRLAFLDSAASAQKPKAVISSLTNTLSGPYANIHRGLYYNSAETTAAFEDARQTIAEFFSADPTGLIFTRNTTESINLIAQSWGRSHLKASSIIVLTEIEHHANIVPWQLLQAEIGFSIKVIPLSVLQAGDQESFTPFLEGASLLSITQMSNLTGFKPRLDVILPLARSHGLTILVDGSQAAVHHPQNLTTLDTDFYVATGHKLYGPTGIGVLWGKPHLLNTLPPYQGGGDMIDEVHLPLGTTFAQSPARFEAGTPAIAEAIALATATKFMRALGWNAIEQHERNLAGQLSLMLASLPFIEQYSPHGTGIAAFNIQGAHPSDVATLLDQQGVAVRSGHHCAMPYIKSLNISGCLRASLALYSTQEDIEQLKTALEKAHKLLT